MTDWTPEQQAEHRRELVKWLRSGDYDQTTGVLCEVLMDEDDDEPSIEYCIMGLACEVSGLGEWVDYDKTEAVSMKGWAYVVGAEVSTGVLPRPVAEYYGFRTKEGEIEQPRTHITPDGRREDYTATTTLIEMNDNGMTFDLLAHIIAAEFDGLVGDFEDVPSLIPFAEED